MLPLPCRLRPWLLLFLLCRDVIGVRFFYCNIRGQPIVKLRYDSETRTYNEIDGENGQDGNGTRFLGTQIGDPLSWTTEERTSDSGGKALLVTSRQTQEAENVTSGDLVYARKCFCSQLQNFYCEVHWGDCGIPRHFHQQISGVPPRCVNEDRDRNFVRTMWPTVWVGYVCLLIALVCTQPGRHVIDFFINLFCGRRWNSVVANRILRRDPVRANTMVQRFWNRRRRYLELRYQRALTNQNGNAPVAEVVLPDYVEGNAEELPPTELALKTKIYKTKDLESEDEVVDDVETSASKGSSNEDDDHADTCTICFGQLQDGDRVGSLPCRHVFHVDCLKSWLKRRNVCPLCQMPNVATPRRSRPCEERVDDEERVEESEHSGD